MARSEFSLISELHLQSASITADGLFMLSQLRQTDLQVIDLANNELGNDACYHLRHVLPTLVSLNISNCKIKEAGAIELSRGLPSARRIKMIDMSQNSVEGRGFSKIL